MALNSISFTEFQYCSMTTELKNKADLPPVSAKLFQAYKDSGLNSSSTYHQRFRVAEQFAKKLSPSEIAEFESSNLVSVMKFDHSVSTGSSEQFLFEMGLRNFYSTVLHVIQQYTPKFQDFRGFQRQEVPPLEAYDHPVGHNELDIKPKSGSYALLFS
jgi:hypothetical protein